MPTITLNQSIISGIWAKAERSQFKAPTHCCTGFGFLCEVQLTTMLFAERQCRVYLRIYSLMNSFAIATMSPVTEMCLTDFNTSMCTSNSCDWNRHVLASFWMSHQCSDTLQRIVQLVQIWWMPSVAQFPIYKSRHTHTHTHHMDL